MIRHGGNTSCVSIEHGDCLVILDAGTGIRRLGERLLSQGRAGGIEGNGIGSNDVAQIDARVDASQAYLFENYPGTRDLAADAAGILYMPLVTEAGLGFGGSFGRGALRIAGATVDYYSATRATIGLQIGAQQ